MHFMKEHLLSFFNDSLILVVEKTVKLIPIHPKAVAFRPPSYSLMLPFAESYLKGCSLGGSVIILWPSNLLF